MGGIAADADDSAIPAATQLNVTPLICKTSRQCAEAAHFSVPFLQESCSQARILLERPIWGAALLIQCLVSHGVHLHNCIRSKLAAGAAQSP